jgi:hypothetical protein
METRAKEFRPMPNTIPVLQIRKFENGQWYVHAEFADGTVKEVKGFKTENEANEWVANDLQHWLDQRERTP